MRRTRFAARRSRARALGRIEGRVVDATGAPARDFVVGVFKKHGSRLKRLREVTPDAASGAFTVDLLEPGSYVLEAVDSVGARAWTPLLAVDLETVMEGLELRLR